jgi:hypothetical protein
MSVFLCFSLTEEEGGDALWTGFAQPAVQGEVEGFPGGGFGVGAVAQTIAEAVMHLERDGVELGLEPGAELDLAGFGGGKQGVFVRDTDRVAQEGGAGVAGGEAPAASVRSSSQAFKTAWSSFS